MHSPQIQYNSVDCVFYITSFYSKMQMKDALSLKYIFLLNRYPNLIISVFIPHSFICPEMEHFDDQLFFLIVI